MKEMVAYCGIPCHMCDARVATVNDDDEKRAETAKTWSEQYKADIKPEDINCEGCISEGSVLFSHCKECEIRACGLEKEVENCGHCSDYACEKLEAFFQMVPFCREQLDKIHAGL